MSAAVSRDIVDDIPFSTAHVVRFENVTLQLALEASTRRKDIKNAFKMNPKCCMWLLVWPCYI